MFNVFAIYLQPLHNIVTTSPVKLIGHIITTVERDRQGEKGQRLGSAQCGCWGSAAHICNSNAEAGVLRQRCRTRYICILSGSMWRRW